jgi:hypothetical protein
LLRRDDGGSKHLWKSIYFYQTTRRNNPEDSHIHTRRRENLKSHIVYWINDTHLTSVVVQRQMRWEGDCCGSVRVWKLAVVASLKFVLRHSPTASYVNWVSVLNCVWKYFNSYYALYECVAVSADVRAPSEPHHFSAKYDTRAHFSAVATKKAPVYNRVLPLKLFPPLNSELLLPLPLKLVTLSPHLNSLHFSTGNTLQVVFHMDFSAGQLSTHTFLVTIFDFRNSYPRNYLDKIKSVSQDTPFSSFSFQEWGVQTLFRLQSNVYEFWQRKTEKDKWKYRERKNEREIKRVREKTKERKNKARKAERTERRETNQDKNIKVFCKRRRSSAGCILFPVYNNNVVALDHRTLLFVPVDRSK